MSRSLTLILQTYWQTETGSHLIAPLCGITPTKPGSACLPFFGIQPAILDPETGEELQGNGVEGALVVKQSWPSMARTIWGSHKRYTETYFEMFPGYYVCLQIPVLAMEVTNNI